MKKSLLIFTAALPLATAVSVVSCNSEDVNKKSKALKLAIDNAEKQNAELTSKNKTLETNLNNFYKTDDTNVKELITNMQSTVLVLRIVQMFNDGEFLNMDTNQKIEKISSMFLDLPYFANRLIGSPEQKEVLVADLMHLDCFTYLDYVNALLNANSYQKFIENLKATRYIDSKVEYSMRKHFFSDWEFSNKPIVKNLINDQSVGAQNVTTVTMTKNLKDNNEVLKGVPSETRTLKYLKVEAVNDQFMRDHFKSGDLIMLAAPEINGLNKWLDVTHCGILIFKDNKAYYRNASSSKKYNKVVDINLVDYLTDRNFNSKENKPYDVKRVPGIFVYRVIDQ